MERHERPAEPMIPEPSRPRRPPTTPRRLRIAGAAASAVALAGLWVASSLVETVPFPPTAVAERIIRATPGDLATFLIESLGMWASRLLTLGALIAALLLGAEALVRTARRGRVRAVLAGGLLAVLAGLASLTQPSFQPDLAVTTLVVLSAGLLYAAVARALAGRVTAEVGSDETRRAFLRLGFGGAAGLALAGGVVGFLLRRLSGPDTDVVLVQPASPAVIPVRAEFPDIPGLTPEITTPAEHYVVDIDLVSPSVEAEGWKLEVSGEVDEPLSLSFERLQTDFEVVEEFSVLTCVSNEVGGELVGNSAWGGVRLQEVLERAGVTSKGKDVVFRAADGYSDSIPLDVAMRPETLLAVSQSGAPLTQDHGFPCRVRVPAIYGMKNVKWVQGIEVVSSDYIGYWQKRGWSDEAEVKTGSRIDVAGNDYRARRGEATWIAGVAWAGTRGISKVEVSIDQGATWREAMLKEAVSESSWRLWAFRWTPEKTGNVSVACRATDGPGDLQVRRLAPPHPDGSSGYHRVDVEVA